MRPSTSRPIAPALFAIVVAAFLACEAHTLAEQTKAHNTHVAAVEFDERIIYHSPETPGYTAWVGLWQLPNGTIQCDFRQQTGPKDKLNVTYAVIESNDGAQTWNRTAGDVPEGSCRGMAVLGDGTMVRVSWSGPGAVQRSTDAGRTWSDPIFFLPKDQYTSRPTVIRPLHDGRLVLFAGCRKQTDPEYKLVKTMFVSSDQGKTWGPPITLMSAEEGLNEESDFCELPSGDLLWIHRSEHYPGKFVPVPPLAYHEPGSAKTPADFCYTDRWQSIARKSGNTFVPQPPTKVPFAHSGFPCVLRTREGIVLHLATGASHWSADEGKTWNKLMVGDKPLGTHYYPRAFQMADGRILCIGHRGGDDIYGTVDQAIIQQMFRLK